MKAVCVGWIPCRGSVTDLDICSSKMHVSPSCAQGVIKLLCAWKIWCPSFKFNNSCWCGTTNSSIVNSMMIVVVLKGRRLEQEEYFSPPLLPSPLDSFLAGIVWLIPGSHKCDLFTPNESYCATGKNSQWGSGCFEIFEKLKSINLILWCVCTEMLRKRE